MIGKLIVYAEDRDRAIITMRRALEELIVEGIATTVPLYLQILAHSSFTSGDFDTGFIDTYFASS